MKLAEDGRVAARGREANQRVLYRSRGHAGLVRAARQVSIKLAFPPRASAAGPYVWPPAPPSTEIYLPARTRNQTVRTSRSRSRSLLHLLTLTFTLALTLTYTQTHIYTHLHSHLHLHSHT